MVREHNLIESRKVRLAVAMAHVVVGVALALFIHYRLDHLFDIFGHEQQGWWDSYWMPLGVACLMLTAEAVWLRLPMAWLYGLLITAPPYGFYAGWAIVWLKLDTQLARLALISPLLGLSGAVLNPLICWLVARGKKLASGRR